MRPFLPPARRLAIAIALIACGDRTTPDDGATDSTARLTSDSVSSTAEPSRDTAASAMPRPPGTLMVDPDRPRGDTTRPVPTPREPLMTRPPERRRDPPPIRVRRSGGETPPPR